MGGKQSVFDEERMKVYQECTFFTRKQVLHLYKRFSSINPRKIDPRKGDAGARFGEPTLCYYIVVVDEPIALIILLIVGAICLIGVSGLHQH